MNRVGLRMVDTAQRTRMPFQERIDYCDKQIVMAATGGLLTTLAESATGTYAIMGSPFAARPPEAA